MRIARDGKPYDIDNMAWDVSDEEIEIIQYLRPNGKRRRMTCIIGKELREKADEKEIIISSEELTTGQIAIYGRFKSEPVEDERLRLATNGNGKNSPDKVLIKLIEEMIHDA